MPSVTVVGGGLAGLSASAALGEAGFDVTVCEAKPYVGGRATSYRVPNGDGTTEVVDNCQHILLKCCTNLLDFYRRLGVGGQVDFHDQFYFIEPGGRTSQFKAGLLPPPAHFAESFLSLKFLSASEKVALARGMLAVQREYGRRTDLDQISMADWLATQNQPPRVIARFWRQVLVSAINEELDRMAAAHGFQVIATGFLGGAESYKMGVPSVTLGELYQPVHWRHLPNVRFAFRSPVTALDGGADYYVLALPFERAAAILPGLEVPQMEHSPITGVHLWFDRSITDLPHATLLDRNIHWLFNKGGGQHLQLVISASRSMVPMSQPEIIDLCLRELTEFFPATMPGAQLVRARVIKEVRATFSAAPGLEARRPGPLTHKPNVFLAGDWTCTGWPSTMEGAVRSGYIAAEAVTRAAGSLRNFLLRP